MAKNPRSRDEQTQPDPEVGPDAPSPAQDPAVEQEPTADDASAPAVVADVGAAAPTTPPEPAEPPDVEPSVAPEPAAAGAAPAAPDASDGVGHAGPQPDGEPGEHGPTAHARHGASEPGAVAAHDGGASSTSGWAKLGQAMRPQVTRSTLLAGILCALLGFALAVQVSQTQEQQLSSLRQSDLVRLLDDVTQRANELETRVAGLQATRDELKSGTGQKRAALELAQKQSESQGLLSGRLPAEGPGIELTILETGQHVSATKLFNILEELRNAGAEVMSVNDVRLVTSSYFEDSAGGVVVDGQQISSPYRWTVIGDPSTLETALEIPGGAMATVRTVGAVPSISQEDLVTVSSTREPQAPQFATPAPVDGAD